MTDTAPDAPPFAAAKWVADEWGLDQVVIIGRKHGEGGFETVTTYGRSDDDARVCDMIGTRIKLHVMQWETDHCDEIADRIRLGRDAPMLERQRNRLLALVRGIQGELISDPMAAQFFDHRLIEEAAAAIADCESAP